MAQFSELCAFLNSQVAQFSELCAFLGRPAPGSEGQATKFICDAPAQLTCTLCVHAKRS